MADRLHGDVPEIREERDHTPLAPPALRVLVADRVGYCITCRGELLDTRALAIGPALAFRVEAAVVCSCERKTRTDST